MTLQMRFFSKKNKIKKFRSNVQKGRRRCIFIIIEKSWGSDRKEKKFLTEKSGSGCMYPLLSSIVTI